MADSTLTLTDLTKAIQEGEGISHERAYDKAFNAMFGDRKADDHKATQPTSLKVQLSDSPADKAALAAVATRFTESVIAKSDAFYAHEVAVQRAKPPVPPRPSPTYDTVLQVVANDANISVEAGAKLLAQARENDRRAAEEWQNRYVGDPTTFTKS